MSASPGLVYILHFTDKLHHAQHYSGYSKNKRTLKLRIQHHIAGAGSRLCRAVSQAGIGIQLARIFPRKDRNFERKLKNTQHIHRYCPICNPNAVEYKPRKKVEDADRTSDQDG